MSSQKLEATYHNEEVLKEQMNKTQQFLLSNHDNKNIPIENPTEHIPIMATSLNRCQLLPRGLTGMHPYVFGIVEIAENLTLEDICKIDFLEKEIDEKLEEMISINKKCNYMFENSYNTLYRKIFRKLLPESVMDTFSKPGFYSMEAISQEGNEFLGFPVVNLYSLSSDRDVKFEDTLYDLKHSPYRLCFIRYVENSFEGEGGHTSSIKFVMRMIHSFVSSGMSIVFIDQTDRIYDDTDRRMSAKIKSYAETEYVPDSSFIVNFMKEYMEVHNKAEKIFVENPIDTAESSIFKPSKKLKAPLTEVLSSLSNEVMIFNYDFIQKMINHDNIMMSILVYETVQNKLLKNKKEALEKNRPSMRIDEIPGLPNKTKRALEKVLHSFRKKNPEGIILYGPPGTGKTMLASSLAKESGRSYVSGSFSEWQSNAHLGDVICNIRQTFKEARRNAPSVLFLDEIDSIPSRENEGRNQDYWIPIVNCLLEEIQGIYGNSDIAIIGATNRLESLDSGITRRKRLGIHIEIALPDNKGKAEILRHYLPELSDKSATMISESFGPCSAADIEGYSEDVKYAFENENKNIEQVAFSVLETTFYEKEKFPYKMYRFPFAIGVVAQALLAINFNPEIASALTLSLKPGLRVPGGVFGIEYDAHTLPGLYEYALIRMAPQIVRKMLTKKEITSRILIPGLDDVPLINDPFSNQIKREQLIPFLKDYEEKRFQPASEKYKTIANHFRPMTMTAIQNFAPRTIGFVISAIDNLTPKSEINLENGSLEKDIKHIFKNKLGIVLVLANELCKRDVIYGDDLITMMDAIQSFEGKPSIKQKGINLLKHVPKLIGKD